MHALVRSFLLIALFTTLGTCQPRSVPAVALTAYVNDPAHGLQQGQSVGNMRVSVTYQPTDLLVTRELQEGESNQVVVDSLREKYRHSTFFLLSIARDGQEVLQPRAGFAQYSELLQTLSFRMGDYVRLVTSQGDTLRPANYYLDRTYAASSASQLMFAFPFVPPTGTWQFHLVECGLGTGNLSFVFDPQLIRGTPTLAIP